MDGKADQAGLRWLMDRAEIVDTVDLIATSFDAREWATVRSLLADEVEVEHPSLTGGETETLGADALVEGWRAALSGYDATQHAVTNHRLSVYGNGAACSAHVVAEHYLLNYQGSDSWTLRGRYDYGLSRTECGWKVDSARLAVLWAEGNQLLPRLARRRFEEGLAGNGRPS